MAHDEDHSRAVRRTLEAAGREVVRLDLADFPARGDITLDYATAGEPVYTIRTPTAHAHLERCRAAWWRRVRPFTADRRLGSLRDQNFAISETGEALHGLFHSLDCTWVNPPALDAVAHHKPYQWQVARRMGLSLPRTLVTNQAEKARRFIREIGVGRTVFKAFVASADAWRETRLVRAEDLTVLETVRYAPVIFQEYVPGKDLRVTVVGDRVFAAEIDATQTGYPVDMRMVVGEARVRPVGLPTAVTDRLLRVMRALGLVFGAIDLRRRADGEYVFLEVNPAGQWLFVEERTGLPITAEVAALLSRLDEREPEPDVAAGSLVGEAR
ncbi:MvdC/MvdD family ATP grasp protein [Streptomyces sp. TLI_105]|uniref:MvdC/MvdD family ATP grasp protein n=1 Tax=Streptomyces sp. TLI_105 TaxID=1881019 RepID=UPI00115FEDBB|nr:alpha-L-glutamate ligase [Streptomyces sp. TLI_105]